PGFWGPYQPHRCAHSNLCCPLPHLEPLRPVNWPESPGVPLAKMPHPQPASSIKAAAPLRYPYNSWVVHPWAITRTSPLRGASNPLRPSSWGSPAPPPITAPISACAAPLPSHLKRVDLGSYQTGSCTLPHFPRRSGAPSWLFVTPAFRIHCPAR
ncbi:hypothetical protein B0H16DRAFT_100621, partial [Mycena metata]